MLERVQVIDCFGHYLLLFIWCTTNSIIRYLIFLIHSFLISAQHACCHSEMRPMWNHVVTLAWGNYLIWVNVKWKLSSWNYPADAPIIDKPFHQSVSFQPVDDTLTNLSYNLTIICCQNTVTMATKRKWVMFWHCPGHKIAQLRTMEKLTALQYVWSCEIDCASQVTLRMSTHTGV